VSEQDVTPAEGFETPGGIEDVAFTPGDFDNRAGIVFPPLPGTAGDRLNATVDPGGEAPEQIDGAAITQIVEGGETTSRSMSLQGWVFPVACEPKATASSTSVPISLRAVRYFLTEIRTDCSSMVLILLENQGRCHRKKRRFDK